MAGATTSNARIERLAPRLEREGWRAAFFTSAVNMGYLHGFFEAGGERFLTLAVRDDGACAMICPALSATQALRIGIADVRAWRDGEDPLTAFRNLVDEWGLASAVVGVDDEMSASMLLAMQAVTPATLFKPASAALAPLMRTKDGDELALMQRAADIADAAIPAAYAAVRPGASERHVEAAILAEMARLGGKPTFCIVATGANGAEPHHSSDDTPIRDGDVVILDFGCGVDGYQSDITRTVCMGTPPPDAEHVYRTVYAAHVAGRRAATPGASGHEVDAAARGVIEGAGFGEYFMHRTGHGIGMRGHEEPFIVAGNHAPLAPGDCFSVEPGIYLPGRFGVRIENIVALTPTGAHSLDEEPPSELPILRP